jgi:hypothetical protein
MILNLLYLIPALIRHFIPEKLVRTLWLRHIIIQSGLETNNPFATIQQRHNLMILCPGEIAYRMGILTGDNCANGPKCLPGIHTGNM